LHPLALSFFAQRKPQAVARSQVLSNSNWKKSPFYNEVDRPYGIEDTATIFLFTDDNTALALTCGRSRTFSRGSLETVESLARVLGGLKRFHDGEPSQKSSEVRKTLDTLTTRELEVLHWVQKGKRNSEIALILRISAHTVHHHLEKIFAKLGVENRTAAAAFTATGKSPDDGDSQVLQKNR
jgi:DNA-binding CsgD family transcriptional regulator